MLSDCTCAGTICGAATKGCKPADAGPRKCLLWAVLAWPAEHLCVWSDSTRPWVLNNYSMYVYIIVDIYIYTFIYYSYLYLLYLYYSYVCIYMYNIYMFTFVYIYRDIDLFIHQCNSIKFKIIPIKAKILLIKLCVCKYGLDTSQEGEGQQKEWSCLPHA